MEAIIGNTEKLCDFLKKMIIDTLKLEDLDGMPLISLGTRSPLGKLLDSHIASSGTGFRTVAEVETYQMAKALVAHGAGISIIDEITALSTWDSIGKGSTPSVTWPGICIAVASTRVSSPPAPTPSWRCSSATTSS